MKEGKEPKLVFCSLLGFLVFFQLLEAIPTKARIFGWVSMAHLAEGRLSFTLL
jgi:hypothetical protein